MELTLTSAEGEFLLEVLEEHHRELLREIARATHHEFKVALKNKEGLLDSTLRKLKASHFGELAVNHR